MQKQQSQKSYGNKTNHLQKQWLSPAAAAAGVHFLQLYLLVSQGTPTLVVTSGLTSA